MSNPFYDWRNPARPCMWSKDYSKHDHVKKINETITHYNDGLLTTAELAYQVFNQFSIGYTLGLEDANYPMPAIRLQVVWPDVGYANMIYIDAITDHDDRVMVCAWDFHLGRSRIGKYGEYTRT